MNLSLKKATLTLAIGLCLAGCKKNDLVNVNGIEGANKSTASVSAVIPPDFTIALLPDIQFTTDPGPEGGLEAMFTAEIKWIMDNRAAENIVYVGGLGDISDSGDQSWSDAQWTRVQNNFYGNKTGYAKGLETPITGFPYGIPYGNSVGNHDQRNPDEGPTKPCAKYNAKLGRSHFANTAHPYYGGSYTTANNNNHYQRFSVGVSPNKMDFMVIHLNYDEFYTQPDVTQWARNLCTANPNTKVIVITHYISSPDRPANWSKQGLNIWGSLRGLPNVFMFAGGHITGEGYREDKHNGYTIKTFQTDYQGWDNGGEGYFRLMKFSAANNLISVRTYSPYKNIWQTGPWSQFTKPWFDIAEPAAPIIPDGKYKILVKGTNKAVRVHGASTADFANITIEEYTTGTLPDTADEWDITNLGGNKYKILNKKSGKALRVFGADLADGARCVQETYTTSTVPDTCDEWSITVLPDGSYKILNIFSGKSLHPVSLNDFAQVVQDPYVNTQSMQFQLTQLF